jgi:non-specific serine/threonine protein kinase
LGISGEVVWRLDPLRPPESPATLDPATPAVELFLRRAVEAVPGFTVNDADLVQVSRICRRLDGLPLALELAAAQLRTLPLTALDERLAKDLNVLSARVHRDDIRHSSLAAVFDWSCRLLDEPERRLLAQLSFFRDGFTLDAAEDACAGTTLLNAEILPTLAALVERSLVQPYDTPHGRRYRLLETVRELAAKRLARAAPPPPGKRAKPEPQYSRTTIARFWPD